ncbi:MAG: penicillin-binding protein 2 [Anaerolineae bacterium]
MFFRLVVIAAFAAVVFKLWDLQIVSSQEFQAKADTNRFRLVQVDAPRGIIYDRAGRLLVRNVPSFAVNIVPGALPEDSQKREAVLIRLGQFLNMPVRDSDIDAVLYSNAIEGTSPVAVRAKRNPSIEGIIRARYNGVWTPIRIASNVARDTAFIIEESQPELPGVTVVAEPIRQYLEGELMAQILGYEGRIPESQIEAYQANTEEKYQPDDLVGLTGIEETQETLLRGAAGQKHIQVDVYEREVSVVAQEPATPGDNIRLTVDVDLQRAVEQFLREGLDKGNVQVGAAIVLDPRTGEVLAIVTLPTYDNNLFSGGISSNDFSRLNNDANRPMVNQAITGQYPPGSTFKVIPAAAALQEGIIDASTSFVCQGTMVVPNKYFPNDPTKSQTFYCWLLWGHGYENVITALRDSCDVFFYQVGGGYKGFEGLGIDTLNDYMKLFGFGVPTGIELTGEAKGLVPTSRWKSQNYGEAWALGDTYNASIGQGFVLVTPLQLVNATAAIANGGTLYRPQLIAEVTDYQGKTIETLTPEVIRQLPISDDALAIVREGMRQAVSIGTARLGQVPGIEVAGKTGSAEFAVWDEDGNLVRNELGHLPTHAWYIAFAPFENPEIAVVVFLRGAGSGAEMAAPVASNIMRFYFGLPTIDLQNPTGQIID